MPSDSESEENGSDEEPSWARFNSSSDTEVHQEILGCDVPISSARAPHQDAAQKDRRVVCNSNTWCMPLHPDKRSNTVQAATRAELLSLFKLPRINLDCRYRLTLKQYPNSQHLGLTVWDASIVLAKLFEHVCLTMLVMCPPCSQLAKVFACCWCTFSNLSHTVQEVCSRVLPVAPPTSASSRKVPKL